MKDAKLAMVREDGILPSDFFVTSNRRTWVMVKGKKIEVKDIRMDCAIVVDPEKMRATCLEPRKIKKGMYVVVGNEGIIEEGEMGGQKERRQNLRCSWPCRDPCWR